MKKLRWIQICFLLFVCMNVAVWATHATGQEKDAAAVEKEMEKVMPLLKGEQWQKMDPNSKVAFIWGAAHVVLIEAVLMEEIPELKRENFSAKVVEARTVKAKAGKAPTINEIISAIDQYYKEHPDQLGAPVMGVIWNVGVKPYLKTGIAGRPLK
ncbi:MAG TPA: hypothetical protein VMV04_16130 [Thermodesulfobacteriota bacterium]|nr:hypothetical protein [Thermodesulfobacteriota bacterium]